MTTAANLQFCIQFITELFVFHRYGLSHTVKSIIFSQQFSVEEEKKKKEENFPNCIAENVIILNVNDGTFCF